MPNSATVATPVHDTSVHQPRPNLTAEQGDLLRVSMMERQEAQRQRVARAEEELDAFGPADSPADREMARESLAALREGAQLLDDALERLIAGTYGRCVSCAGAIPFERLEAIPDVRHCVSCPRPA